MSVIDRKTMPYFSMMYTIVGGALAFISMFLVFINTVIGILLAVIGFVLLSTQYRLRIDLSNKTFHDYLWILGFKKGEKGTFDEIQYLYITKSKISRTMNLESLSSTIAGEEFNGYLKFSEDQKIHITSQESKSGTMKKLKEFSALLGVQVVDYTEE
jgi:hypothetical protein